MPPVPAARHLLRAKDFVDARYAEQITVEDLAAAAGLSRAHFSRMFSKTFGFAALHRPLGGRHLCDGRAPERRVIHQQLRAGIRPAAGRIPGEHAARICVRACTEQHSAA